MTLRGTRGSFLILTTWLLAILALYFRAHTFDMMRLASMGHATDLALQRWLFLGFFLGFAVKVPSFPFHTWLPDAHVDAPTPGSVLLAGVLLKMGGYGFFRIAYPICPDGAQSFGWLMALLGVISIVYGAFVAMAQTDFKRLVAYSSVSHMGFVMLGLASLTPEGLNGAMFQMFSHGMITGAMFLLVGILYERRHTPNAPTSDRNSPTNQLRPGSPSEARLKKMRNPA